MEEAGREVSLLVKDLPSFEFVVTTYLAQGGLHEEDWLSSRARLEAPAPRATGT
jgi:hypothetical protein